MRTGKFIIGILLLCCFIRMVIGEPCTVPSGSMEPTLLCGDRLWINKLAYGGRFPSRWADIPLLNVFTWVSSAAGRPIPAWRPSGSGSARACRRGTSSESTGKGRPYSSSTLPLKALGCLSPARTIFTCTACGSPVATRETGTAGR